MNHYTNKPIIPKAILEEIKVHLNEQFERRVGIKDDKEIAGWFMGTRGENLRKVKEIISSVLEQMLVGREALFPYDPNYITPSIKSSMGYKNGIQSVEAQTQNLLNILTHYSVPTQSLRYQGHMTWDITLPSMIGYFTGMLQNQNNVTPQASPATTILELMVSNDIARMAGFNTRSIDGKSTDIKGDVSAWAHISCDGSVANIESLWAARELKFIPLGIQYAISHDPLFKPVASVLKLPSGVLLEDATAWELLNLRQDDILELPEKIFNIIKDENGKTTLSEVWQRLTSNYSLNARGLQFFNTEFLQKEYIKMPALIVPSTKHYSWVKASSILGMGHGQKGLSEKALCEIEKIQSDGLINIYVTPEGKVKTDLLKNVLETCRKNKKPIVMVVGVMGTTEEGAVDPMEKIIEIREKYRKKKKSPFEYSVHADAAWGGYFLACLRNEYDMEVYPKGSKEGIFDNKESWFRDSVYTSMIHMPRCDSATIDPHKMGYIPYPAGSLIYRNDKIINLLTFTAPYISSGGTSKGINTRNIGECGIEGSKPGAAAASVYLSHMVIRPDKRGYGKLINQSMLNSKLFYLYLWSLEFHKPEDRFKIVMFDEMPDIIPSENRQDLIDILWHHQTDLNAMKNHDLIRKVLKNIAGDQNLIDYIFLDKKDTSSERTLALNSAIFNKLNLAPGTEVKGDEIFVSMTTFHKADYGNEFMTALEKRLFGKVRNVDNIPCIRSVIMDPWAIYTHEDEGVKTSNFFTEIFIPKLRAVVNGLCEKKDL